MSKEIFKEELNVFRKSYYQNSEEESFLQQFYPVSALGTTNNLEFFIPPSSEYFIDTENIFLWLTLQLVKSDGTPFTASQDNRFSSINYPLNTIWQNVEISLNNTIITPNTNAFSYISYINCLLKNDNKSKHTFLRSSGKFNFLLHSTLHISIQFIF